MRFIEGGRLSELREVFVRSRFAEEAFFNNADIEAWLKKQKVSPRPEVCKGTSLPWSRCLSLLDESGIKTRLCRIDSKNVTSTELLRYAGLRGEDVLISKESDTSGWFCRRQFGIPLAISKCISDEVYITRDQLILYPRDHSVCEHLILRPGLGCGGVYYTEGIALLATEIAHSLLLSWEHLPEQDERKYRARTHLCETLSSIVAEVRAQAEEEFNSAVAVSEDGKKIISADSVVVIDTDWESTHFPASYFRKKKIVREELLFRTSSFNTNDSTVESVIKEAMVLHGNDMKSFCKHFGLTDEIPSVTHIYCPGEKKYLVVLENE